jgi:hypothetical protein
MFAGLSEDENLAIARAENDRLRKLCDSQDRALRIAYGALRDRPEAIAKLNEALNRKDETLWQSFLSFLRS